MIFVWTPVYERFYCSPDSELLQKQFKGTEREHVRSAHSRAITITSSIQLIGRYWQNDNISFPLLIHISIHFWWDLIKENNQYHVHCPCKHHQYRKWSCRVIAPTQCIFDLHIELINLNEYFHYIYIRSSWVQCQFVKMILDPSRYLALIVLITEKLIQIKNLSTIFYVCLSFWQASQWA